MSDIEIHMPSTGDARATVIKKIRDIAGRGYDQTTLCRLTKPQTEAVFDYIKQGISRQNRGTRQARIRELKEELAQLEAEAAKEPQV